MLTSESPYRDIDQAAIIYGVGTNRLHLPLPPSVPAGFLLLMRMCWDPKPRNRPSFSSILLHLSIASADLVTQEPEHYAVQQHQWKKEVRSCLRNIGHSASAASSTSSVIRRDHRRQGSSSVDSSNDNINQNNNNNNSNSISNSSNRQPQQRFDDSGSDEPPDQLLRRLAEMKHVNDIRALYEEKLERVNNLYAEVASLKAILEEQARNKPKYETFNYFC